MSGPFFHLLKDYISPVFPSAMKEVNHIVLLIGSITLLLYSLKHLFESNNSIKGFVSANPAIGLLMVFALLMLVSTIANGFSQRLLFGTAYRKEGLVGYLSYIVYFLLMAVCNDEGLRKIWLYSFVALSFVAQISTIAYHYWTDYYMVDFMFHQYNHYGYYLMMSIASSALLIITSKALWQRIIFSASLFTGFLALLINDTFGCQLAIYIGLLASAIILGISKGRFIKITLLPVAVIVLSILFGVSTSEVIKKAITTNSGQLSNDTGAMINGKDEAERTTGVSRIILWEYGFSYAVEKPILGHGADATAQRLIKDTNDNDRCHCEYLNLAISFGFPAALIFIAAIALVYLRGFKYKTKLSDTNIIGLCGAIYYLASAVLGNSMYYTAPYLYIFLGMGYFVKAQKQK